MHRRTTTWLLLSVLLFAAAYCLWDLGDKRAARKADPPRADSLPVSKAVRPSSPGTVAPGSSSEGRVATSESQSSPTQNDMSRKTADRSKYRISNTAETVSQLIRNDKAILLENARFDTAQPFNVQIPGKLHIEGDPGSYIVQAGGAIGSAFRARLKMAGASIVAYIPNNAYLVRATQDAAQQLAGDPGTTVLPYDAYYKLKWPLLAMAAEEQSPPADAALDVLLFPDCRNSTLTAIERLGGKIMGEEASPFGPVLRVAQPGNGPPASFGDYASALARLPGVQEIELGHRRAPANDLSRGRIGVAADTIVQTNYLGLDGTNVFININDTGVDTNQPDLAGRVLFDAPASGVDTNGHGTHVAGTIAGSGEESTTVTNAQGSIMPGTIRQFRGMAPAAQLFSMLADPGHGPYVSDAYLQATAAQTNALLGYGWPFISNNSWTYHGDTEYDLAAASYDAAVRDALPQITGAQPGLYVFAAGNANHAVNIWDDGSGDDGFGGAPDSIESPGTAKNVITVGAIEQPRFITNEAVLCTTITIIYDMTNSVTTCVTNQEWLPSTDSSNQVAGFSAEGNVGIGIEGSYGRFKPDVVAPGSMVISTRSTKWDEAAYYNPASTNQSGDFLNVLSNLNDTLGPYYRYESGTSMAAAEVSGTLALMQQFFQQQLKLTNSPALMKALLVNGSRSLGLYDLGPQEPTNYQGWGLINLPNSLGTLTNLQASPAGPGSMFIFDQSPTNALATGQSNSVVIQMNDGAAREKPLRVTLVWTDPPGNPVAGTKLVNSLVLVVSNWDTGATYFGNDLAAGNEFNSAWDTNTAPNLDLVNNVQNVYLGPPVGSNYTITVLGNRVNVNAVTEQTNEVVQDYALVISAGDGEVADAFVLGGSSNGALVTQPLVTPMLTNGFQAGFNDYGGLLSSQRVGANTALWGTNSIPIEISGGMVVTNATDDAAITIGMTNQWHFYMVSNGGGADFTNAAFVTLLPTNLSIPGAGVYQENEVSNATRFEPDIDLYVTTDPTLTNLNPTAIAGAYKSLSRGGQESVVLSNSAPGTVYYAGVKSEDQEAAQYSFLANFSNVPYEQSSPTGDHYVRGFPAPVAIPGGTSMMPGIATLVGLCSEPVPVHRVVVTNNLTAPLLGSLLGTLNHEVLGQGAYSAVLNNSGPSYGVTNETFVYDDSGENDIPGSRHTDGPGNLNLFAGRAAGPSPWILTESDTDPARPGTNNAFDLYLQKQQDPQNGIYITLSTNGCDEEFISIPAEATNLVVVATNISEGGPVSLKVCSENWGGCQSTTIPSGALSAGSIQINKANDPPLNAGTYEIALCNRGPQPVTIFLTAYVSVAQTPVQPVVFTSAGSTALVDDGITYSSINVPTNANLVSVDVGVRINHPRVSDLVLTLISPNGTRQLLCENRGALTPFGMGTDYSTTNSVTVNSSGGFAPETNTFVTGTSSGVIQITYDMYRIPDDMFVYYGTNPAPANLIWTSGFVSLTGTTNLTYPPPGYTGAPSTSITVVMNQYGYWPGGDSTLWEYSVSSAQSVYNYLTFTENRNLTAIPMKFAAPPFTNTVTATNLGPKAMSDSFQFGMPTTNFNTAGQAFAEGWVLQIGSVGVLTNGYGPGLVCDSGNQCLLLNPYTAATVVTNLSLTPGANYLLKFAYAVDPDVATNNPQAIVQIGGEQISVPSNTSTNANSWANVGWQLATLPFTAMGSSQTLTISGSGMLLDTFSVQLVLEQTGLFYLPEEPLTKVRGENVQGAWQLEIRDDRAGPAAGTNEAPELLSWGLSFVLATPQPLATILAEGTNSTNTVCDGQIQNFAVTVPMWATSVTNTLVSATEPVNVIFNLSSEAETNVPGDVTNLAGTTGGGFILTTNSAPFALVPGSTYYVGVQSLSSNCASFVFQIDFPLTTLSNAVPLASTMATNDYTRYFVFNVASNATTVLFQLTNLNANASLVASPVPFPDLEVYDHGSFNAGTANQQIYIFTNSQPYPLTPGNWYLGVFNNSNTNLQFTIEAIEYADLVPNIITLEDGVAFTNVNAGVSITDYYDFEVTNTAARAQFEIDNPSGEEVLVLRNGLPLPSLSSYQLISDNPGTEGQLLVLYTNSGPVLLTAGWWFLSAINLSGGTNNYVIEATTWPTDGGPIVITDEVWSPTNVCLTWTSVPGFEYYIQGKASLTSTTWFTVSPTIEATDTNTTGCVALPSEFQFFRVALSLGAEAMPLGPVAFTGISRGTNGVLLQWMAATNNQFLVQWSRSLAQPMNWNTFNGVVTSKNAHFFFLDNGTQGDGLSGSKYYRLMQLP